MQQLEQLAVRAQEMADAVAADPAAERKAQEAAQKAAEQAQNSSEEAANGQFSDAAAEA